MRLQTDKVLHFVGGVFLTVGFSIWVPPIPAAGLTCCVGLLKEVYDYMRPTKHTACIYDALSTAAGGLIGSVLLTTFV